MQHAIRCFSVTMKLKTVEAIAGKKIYEYKIQYFFHCVREI